MLNENNKQFLKEVDRIIIPLGLKCNLKCRHCIQNSNKMYGFKYEENCISDDLIELLTYWSHVCQYVAERKIFQKPTIIFYGGEPLVYFDKIKKIVGLLFEAGFDFAKVDFKIFSNMILLNEEMVLFFNKWHFKVGLSADGPNLKYVRPEFPDDDKIRLWKTIENRFVVCTIMAGNPDFVKNVLFLKKRFDVDVIDVELVCVGWDMDKDIFDFKKSIMEGAFKKIILYYSGHKLDDAFYSFFRTFFSDLILKSRYNTFVVDCFGNVGVSRFYNAPLGTINDDLFDLKKRSSEICSARILNGCKCCSSMNHCYVKDYLQDLRYKDVPGYYCNYVKIFTELVDKYKAELVNLIRRYD